MEEHDVFALEAKIESKNPIIMEWLSAPVIEASQNSNEIVTMGVTGAANLEDRQRHGSQEFTLKRVKGRNHKPRSFSRANDSCVWKL